MPVFLDIILAGYAFLIFLFAGYEKITLIGFPSLPDRGEIVETIPLPRVSIVLPVRNQGKTLEECLASLINIDYSNKEIIVVEGGSTDETEAILGRHRDKIKLTREEALPVGWVGKNWACHLGYKEAKGELFLFTDGDSVHSHDSL
ncbi:MAG TPA: glycosyltransferase family 2 protein, partial [Candidatus Binatus sp.]|nr:glycosyltransferase family 2 protein [Candidatus Binatus sp.]